MKATTAVAAALLTLCASLPATADERVDACIAAFDEAQAARLRHELVRARRKLLECSQSSCPAVLRGDCASVLREVEETLPTVVPTADEAGRDVTDVSVLEGNEVIATTLDGTPIPLDPGPHTLRFERIGSTAVEVPILVAAGDKNRRIHAAFASATAPAATPQRPPVSDTPLPSSRRSLEGYLLPGALALVGIGGVTVAGFGRLGFDSRVDEMRGTCAPNCSQESRSHLSDRLTVANTALGIGIAGLVAAVVTWLVYTPSKPGAPQALVGKR